MAVVRIHLGYLPLSPTPRRDCTWLHYSTFQSIPGLALGMVQRAVKSPAVWPYGLEASVKDFGTRGKLLAVLLALTTMLGCGGLNAGTPVAQSNTGLDATSAVVDFGSVPVGTTQVRANTIVNTTKSPVVLTSAQIDQNVFKI